MATDFWIVDTLSKELMRGIPSAVFFVEDLENSELLQNISMEINTTETIFVKREADGKFLCKCFSSRCCGMHFGNSIIAAAKIINLQDQSLVKFNLSVDRRIVPVQVLEDGAIELRFESAHVRKAVMPTFLHSALAGQLIVSVSACDTDLIVEIRSPKKLKNLVPHIDHLKRIYNYESFIITTDAHYETDVNYDFCAKVFAPKLELFHDVLTPMASVKLAKYWSQRMGKNELVGCYQQSGEKNCYVTLKYSEEYTSVTSYCVISTEGKMSVF
jgi:predicted PhzF superfamily epimerase YddE/YHI9